MFSQATQSDRRATRAPVVLRSALVLAGVMALSIFSVQATPAQSDAHASAGLHYQQGYYLDNGWLCYGWNSGEYHCTQHWHRNGGQLVSDNASWVPNVGGVTSSQPVSQPVAQQPVPAAGRGAAAPVSAVQTSSNAGEPCQSTDYFNGTPSAWQVPPSCYAGVYSINPANYVYRSGFGWCNWWPEVLNPSRPDLLWGNYPRGSTPRAGATAVFAPYVENALGGGHYGRVVAVAPGGYWFLMSEMNFEWRGAGFGRVDYRYVHAGAGVSFIYN